MSRADSMPHRQATAHVGETSAGTHGKGIAPVPAGQGEQPMSAKKLSFEQKLILAWLSIRYEDIRASGYMGQLSKSCFEHDGVRWRPSPGSPSERAALSRRLRSLDARGLVIRRNVVSGGPKESQGTRWEVTQWRTTHVCLTEAGEQAAKLLTNMKAQIVNSFKLRQREDAP